MLRQLPAPDQPALLSGRALGDDAAIFQLSDELALVQTVDFFTPIVDDPYVFGQIAAANSLSDVYAVGGAPLTAMNIIGFPIDDLPPSILAEILRGGADKAAEAGVTIVGGHTIDDAEPKYGLAVTGTVHPQHYLSGRGALPGDVLLLTKPIGTGTIATALKGGAADAAHVDSAVRWMTTLNRTAARGMIAAGAHAVSDITGYGLLGHLLELCHSSGVSARLDTSRIPLLPGALKYAADGWIPAGTNKNRAAVEGYIEGRIDEITYRLLADPQTSGGLLIALPAERIVDFSQALDGSVLEAAVGEIVPGEPSTITIGD